MSRREDHRSSDTKRHREPSPKRSRRDVKPDTERQPDDRLDREKSRRRLQDALPLEAPLVAESKVETKTVNKESDDKDKKGSGKHSDDPIKVPRSTTYSQHDDRGSAGHNGRSFSRRTDKDHGSWRDHNKHQNDRIGSTTKASDTHRNDERRKDSRDMWRHDGYFEMEGNRKPTERKRPAFREQKITTDTEKTNKPVDHVTPNPQDRAADSERRRERPFSGAREFNKTDGHRGTFTSFNRNNAGDRYRGRDGLGAGRGSRHSGGAVEKWKHDMYDEANRSPTPKNEEDQISKIEALLAK